MRENAKGMNAAHFAKRVIMCFVDCEYYPQTRKRRDVCAMRNVIIHIRDETSVNDRCSACELYPWVGKCLRGEWKNPTKWCVIKCLYCIVCSRGEVRWEKQCQNRKTSMVLRRMKTRIISVVLIHRAIWNSTIVEAWTCPFRGRTDKNWLWKNKSCRNIDVSEALKTVYINNFCSPELKILSKFNVNRFWHRHHKTIEILVNNYLFNFLYSSYHFDSGFDKLQL